MATIKWNQKNPKARLLSAGLWLLMAALTPRQAFCENLTVEKKSKLSGSATMARSNSLYNRNDGSEESSLDLSVSLQYGLNSSFNLQALVEGSQDLKNDENSDLARAQVSLKLAPISISMDRAKIGASANLGIPVSKSQKAASLQNSVGISSRLDMNSELLFSPKLGLSFMLSGTRNIHQFETALNGRINTQYSSVQGLETSWSFTDATAITVGVNHINTWSYSGTMKEFYNHSEEFSYQVSPRLYLALGHSLGSPYTSVWKSNGQERSFLITDDNDSFAYVSASIQY